jgi:8-oxoguanine deaminase
VDLSLINGRWVVLDGSLQTVDLPRVVTHHNRLARQLAEAW